MILKYNVRFKTILPVIVSVITVIIIEVFRIIDSFPNYDRYFRNFEHLIAAIIVPYALHTFENDSVIFSCASYAFASFIWEIGQFCMRGYFQLDQYLCDLMGVAIIFLIYNFVKMD